MDCTKRDLKVLYERHENLHKDIDDFLTNLYGGYVVKCDEEDVGYLDDFLSKNNGIFRESQILSLLMGDILRANKHDYKLEPQEGERFIDIDEYMKLYDMIVNDME